jgi:hypothetical protein
LVPSPILQPWSTTAVGWMNISDSVPRCLLIRGAKVMKNPSLQVLTA